MKSKALADRCLFTSEPLPLARSEAVGDASFKRVAHEMYGRLAAPAHPQLTYQRRSS